MTTVVRYGGRHGGSGVDDSSSGPEIVAACFEPGAGVRIDDPLSFPWHLVETEQWRQPVTVDLARCTHDDLLALAEVLPVLTPQDRIVADSAVRSLLTQQFRLPDSVYLDTPELDGDTGFEQRRPAKLRLALLREVLAPIVDRELATAGGENAPRPLLVVEWGADDDWHGSFIPDPHRFERRPVDEPAVPGSAAIAIIATSALAPGTMASALAALQPGGLLIVVLDESVVASASSLSTTDVMAMIAAATSGRRVIEHIWGLHPEPGARTLGGVIAVRPLGGTR